MKQIRPQAGPQEKFLACSADVAIYGGEAGGGKTYALLLEDLYHKDNPAFGSVTIRRTFQQIDQEGGLWYEATQNVYKPFGIKPNESKHRIKWPSGARSSFVHLQYEKDVLNYQGGQINLLKIDEGSHFKGREVFYLIGRTRSMSGIESYTRITCNPDPESFFVSGPNGWGSGLISWWIDDDGYAIPERSGVIRYFARNPEDDTFIVEGSRAELLEKHPISPDQVLSLTFILARLEDNKKLLEQDPQYKARLLMLPKVDRERLLGSGRGGNWKIKPAAGSYFKRSYFEIVNGPPSEVVATLRAWDFAATEPHANNSDPDYTASVKISLMQDRRLYIEHAQLERVSPAKLDTLFTRTAIADGPECRQIIPLDPAAAGKVALNHFLTLPDLPRKISIQAYKQHKGRSTETLVGPASSHAERGLIVLQRGPWNAAFLDQLEQYPDGSHDDAVSALVEAVNHTPKTANSNSKARGAAAG